MEILQYENYHEHKIHGDPTFLFDAYCCSIPQDFACVPLHWHDEAELIVVKKGRGTVFVDFAPHTVETGCAVLLMPGQLHAIGQAGDAMEYENILFSMSMLQSGRADACAALYFEPLLSGALRVPPVLTPALACHGALFGCINEIDALSADRDFGWQLLLRSELLRFFYLLVSRCAAKSACAPRPKSYDKLKQILKYVELHFAQPLSIETMAREAGFSASHFMKFFKTSLGVSFTEYLNDYRLTLAARMLLSQSAPVLEIAAQAGFENLSYFNRLFRRKYGVAPTAYRNRS